MTNTVPLLTGGFSPSGVAGKSLWVAADRATLTTYTAANTTLTAAGAWLLSVASGNAIDVSGNARNLTANGTLTYQAAGPTDELPYGISGWSSANYLSSADAAFKTTGAVSISCWFRYTSTGVQQSLVCRDFNSGAGSRDFELFLTAAGLLSFQVFDAANTASTVAATGGQAGSSWNHACGVHTPSGNVKIYLNGVDVTASVVVGPATRGGATAGDMTVGIRTIAASALPAADRIAAVSYFATALSAANVKSLYDAGWRAVDALPNLFTSGATAIQATVARRSTLVTNATRPAVQNLVGTGLDLASMSTRALGHTVLMVGTPAAPAGAERLFYLVGGALNRIFQQSTSQLVGNFSAGGTNVYGTGIAVPAVAAVMAMRVALDGAVTVWNGRTSSRRVYGSDAVAPTDAAVTTGYLGNYSDYASGFTGTWRDALVYDGALTDLQMRGLISYFAARRGIALVAPTRNILFDGDSLTVGYPAFPAYTDIVLSTVGGAFRANNIGISGQKISEIVANSPAKVAALYDGSIAKNILVIWAGTNDIASGVTAATAYTNLTTYCAARRAEGWKVVVSTMLPRTFAGDDAGTEAARITYNTNIRTNFATFADGLADLGLNSTIGLPASQDNATYYQADKAHLTTAGYAIVASLVSTAVSAI